MTDERRERAITAIRNRVIQCFYAGDRPPPVADLVILTHLIIADEDLADVTVEAINANMDAISDVINEALPNGQLPGGVGEAAWLN
ncbi:MULTISPECIES: hypothetical protein [unclassified Mycobacterium]|uniref:hypothetical protein n=1 Tax=unclassified Mycobacterium TaxID=2642494 RepID=UPI0007FCB1E3|nr:MULTISPECIES: hypothetical protein [unclassified Mycobacterium]OBH31601.1 hypothetical protein A5693_15905 [Mycobacterium sp. E1319]